MTELSSVNLHQRLLSHCCTAITVDLPPDPTLCPYVLTMHLPPTFHQPTSSSSILQFVVLSPLSPRPPWANKDFPSLPRAKRSPFTLWYKGFGSRAVRKIPWPFPSPRLHHPQELADQLLQQHLCQTRIFPFFRALSALNSPWRAKDLVPVQLRKSLDHSHSSNGSPSMALRNRLINFFNLPPRHPGQNMDFQLPRARSALNNSCNFTNLGVTNYISKIIKRGVICNHTDCVVTFCKNEWFYLFGQQRQPFPSQGSWTRLQPAWLVRPLSLSPLSCPAYTSAASSRPPPSSWSTIWSGNAQTSSWPTDSQGVSK